MNTDEENVVKEVVEAWGLSCEIAKYELGKYIGRGGSANCYEVRKFQGLTQDHLGEEAVLKIIVRAHEGRTAASVYENEVKALKILNGEYCSRFSRCLAHWTTSQPVKHQTTSAPLKHYIIIEKCAYGSLMELAGHLEEEDREFTELELLFFLREVLRGVRVLHGLRMLHRDLKLQNVMIDREFNVKLIDFGLAKTAPHGQHPQDNSFQGTLSYMSLEILTGQPSSYDADMWAVGVMFYRLIYGAFPFTGTTKGQLQHAVLNEQVSFKKKAELNELKEIVKKLLDKNREERPTAERLLRHGIFEKLEEEKDIRQRIKYKYEDHFNHLSKRWSQWKKPLNRDPMDLNVLRLDPAADLSAEQALLKFARRKAEKGEKVRISQIVHDKKYGFFVLLSNATLVASFNNAKILRFTPSMLHSATSNEQNILCSAYRHHFSAVIKAESEANPGLHLEEPNCSLKKVYFANNHLFVRLTNNALHVFVTRAATDGSLSFSLDFRYNANIHDYAQIAVVEADGTTAKYASYQEARYSPYSKHVDYIKRVFECILDNSSISLEEMELSRNL